MKIEGIFVTQGARFDSFQFDITTREKHLWSNSVPDYPVEVGAPKNNHINPKADRFQLTGIVSRTPISVDRIGQGILKYNEAVPHLRALFNQGLIFVVEMQHGIFSNLAIESVEIVETPKTEGHILATLALKQFNFAAIGTTVDFAAPTTPPPSHAAGSLSLGAQ